MRPRYENAAKVLPHELFTALRRALGGRDCHLWVPGDRRMRREARDARVLELSREGHTAVDIADRLLISERTVWRILAKERARSLPSAPGPDLEEPCPWGNQGGR